jgi:hypothetical protein
MSHFHHAKSATLAIFVFGNFGGDDRPSTLENFSQFSVVHFGIQLVVRQSNKQKKSSVITPTMENKTEQTTEFNLRSKQRRDSRGGQKFPGPRGA